MREHTLLATLPALAHDGLADILLTIPDQGEDAAIPAGMAGSRIPCRHQQSTCLHSAATKGKCVLEVSLRPLPVVCEQQVLKRKIAGCKDARHLQNGVDFRHKQQNASQDGAHADKGLVRCRLTLHSPAACQPPLGATQKVP